MTFGNLLRQNKKAIVQRWLDAALAVYAEDAVAVFGRQKDPFSNPVGHSLRLGTAGLFEVLLEAPLAEPEAQAERVREHLREIVKIRAVQEFSASRAVGFVFRLKQAVRAELGKSADDPALAGDLLEFDGRIDEVALQAFDVYVECRARLSELRINEVKRRVSWVVDKMSERGLGPEPVGSSDPGPAGPIRSENVQ